MDFLRVKGNQIVTEKGDPVRLRGFCLGGWMLMENFINGFAGNEAAFRSAVAKVLGKGRAAFFFERMLHYFITEEDIRFIAGLGANTVRIPFNYRHFEDDAKPFKYREQGFMLLDRVIRWCEKHGLYAILDMHAVQGFQNTDWHCDNPGLFPWLYEHPHFQERAIGLWQELARRYKNEPAVAGYNIMNEPYTFDMAKLNMFYKKIVPEVRKVDKKHILFLEGNKFSSDFTGLDKPFDKNTVYSSHDYVKPGFIDAAYPGPIDGEMWDKNRLESDYDKRNAYMKEHNVPCWVGEFGSVYLGTENDKYRLDVLRDMLSIIESRGHHWTIWTYKDLGLMGSVAVNPESEWARRIAPAIEKKEFLTTDTWPSRKVPLDAVTSTLKDMVEKAGLTGNADGAWFDVRVRRAVRGILLSEPLVPAFAEVFRGMTEKEIDRMMQSFAFQNCLKREPLMNALKTVF